MILRVSFKQELLVLLINLVFTKQFNALAFPGKFTRGTHSLTKKRGLWITLKLHAHSVSTEIVAKRNTQTKLTGNTHQS